MTNKNKLRENLTFLLGILMYLMAGISLLLWGGMIVSGHLSGEIWSQKSELEKLILTTVLNPVIWIFLISLRDGR